MMRNPAHAKLDEFVLVRVTREFVKRLGFRLTHQRIAQLVPVVGAVVNAGTNAASISRLGDRAQDAYRLRFLTEKYELDAADWLSKVDLSVADEESDFIDLEKLVDEAEDEKDDTDPIS